MERMAYISADELDYSAQSDLEGVNQVSLVASPLAVAGTTLTVTTTLLDRTHFVEGLVLGNFRVMKAGAVIAVSAVVANASNNTYALTIPSASAGTYTVELYDTVLPASIIKVSTGLLFKSNVASVIVV
jgi:hypothetical protein